MAACSVDFIHRWNHSNLAVRRLHLLLREGQPTRPDYKFPSLIVHTFV